jgi:GDP/UDP-N,N'-diacetylbacillosamine 2-epimerase (hydrolysing)
MRRKILYISGSRADYGLMRSVLFRINSNPGMELHIGATGMHLLPDFGNTIDEICRDGFTCHRIDAVQERDTDESMALFIGCFIQRCVPLVMEIKPDLILLLGDRGEMLGGAIVGVYLGIPVVHIHGGENTRTVDDIARHAITKLSHIHLAATEESARRIVQMGENPETVHVVGAPGLEQINEIELLSAGEISQRYHLDLSRPVILVLQHPVTLEGEDSAYQMRQTLEAIRELGEQSLIIYPNADAGGRAMIEEIRRYEHHEGIQIFPTLEHRDFLSLLRVSSVLVGNSSSGIIEAPSFGLPVVNIGTRQDGRSRGENVIQSGYAKEQIRSAIEYALHDTAFRERTKKAKNPYGDGNSSHLIVDILERTPITQDLVQKRLAY